MDIFRSLDHREILTKWLDERKTRGEKLSFAKLAELIGVQKPFVSRVMSGETCWSADQAFLIAAELKVAADEAEYFGLLVEAERTGLERRRKALQTRIKELRRKNLRTKTALKAETLAAQDQLMAEYFADPYHSLTHVYLSIPKYQRNMAKLAQTLGLSPQRIDAILTRLEKLKVVRYDRKNDQVELLRLSLQTPADTSLVQAHQTLFRALSLDRFARCSPERKNTFSAVFSGDVSLQETLWAEFLEYLKKVEDVAADDREANEVFYLQFDLFPWNGGEA